MTRFVLLVLDGVGVGALPDAALYGDAGSDTLGNLSRVVGLHLPHLENLGLGNIIPILGVPPVPEPLALAGRLATVSAGKDTTVGHWEHMGLVTAHPFPTYPQGFPEEVLGPFRERIGRGVLGNKTASGTAIIEELGAAHLAGGQPIVYTSADSVFQIAAHVDVVPLETLYRWCEIAREILQGPHGVARVIARPFAGSPGAFVRTKDRRDLSLPPPGPTYLDRLREAAVPVVALGKIAEVFTGRGVTAEIHVSSNADNLALVLDLLRGRSDRGRFDEGLLFTNLVDFDMVWGHRNDVDGFAAGLAAVDAALPGILSALRPGDGLIITADHGVDPTTPSTDHSREYVPLLLYPRPEACPAAVYEGTLADTGATIFEGLTGAAPGLGGDVITAFRPSRGWRRYTPAQSCPVAGHGSPPSLGVERRVPGRVGPADVTEAAAYLRAHLGPPPTAAIVLGSGLAGALRQGLFLEAPSVGVPYGDVPSWRAGTVPGHPYRLTLGQWSSRAVVLLEGRVHGYEGFDLSELQLPVRTMAEWGVGCVLLTSACGAVAAELTPGDVVIASEVLDCQTAGLCRVDTRAVPTTAPSMLPATPADLAVRVIAAAGAPAWLTTGVHACVPGPHYETDAELEVLRTLGASTVSMSGAPELRAVREVGLAAAVLGVVVNAGHTSHGGVLTGAGEAAASFSAAAGAVLTSWGY
jgi:phosphopentomutase